MIKGRAKVYADYMYVQRNKIFMNYRDHLPPHFHAESEEYNCCIR